MKNRLSAALAAGVNPPNFLWHVLNKILLLSAHLMPLSVLYGFSQNPNGGVMSGVIAGAMTPVNLVVQTFQLVVTAFQKGPFTALGDKMADGDKLMTALGGAFYANAGLAFKLLIGALIAYGVLRILIWMSETARHNHKALIYFRARGKITT